VLKHPFLAEGQHGPSFLPGATIQPGANRAGQHVGMLHEEEHHVIGDLPL
jgi:hypothetical protein